MDPGKTVWSTSYWEYMSFFVVFVPMFTTFATSPRVSSRLVGQFQWNTPIIMVKASQSAGHVFEVIILRNNGAQHNIFNLYYHYWTDTLAVTAICFFLPSTLAIFVDLFDRMKNRDV